MIKLGMLVGGRYEILEKIGTGGMSDVYKAKDQKLNRLVAVKVLKQEFIENKNFVSKFRVEAQAAAGLMHPNIVNVYDVGEEDGIHYIVMELVEGITLKKYIEKKSRLTTKEAISIAIQVAMGIEAAHNNHIIHRDIKPQNIIISKEGKVKVTDFGIAKAASSNTITSNVMGSVHYTSPEQARGGFSDEKSDIYSLGITLFEMLTGRVPFNGDTTVAIAIKHIQDPMPTPREFVPEIPVSVENIVMKCTQKSPDRRYQNMGDMIKDLKHSLIRPDDVIAQVDTADEAGQTRVVPPQHSAVQQQEAHIEPMPAVLETVWEDRVPKREAYADEEDLEAIPNQEKPMHGGAGNYDGNYGYDSSYDAQGYGYNSAGYDTQGYGGQGYDNSGYDNQGYDDQGYGGQEGYDNQGYDAYGSQEYEYQDRQQGTRHNSQSSSGRNKKNSNAKNTSSQKNSSKNKSGKKGSSRKNREYEYLEPDEYPQETINRQNMGRLDYESGRSYSSRNEYDYNPKVERVTTVLTVIAAVVIGCILLYFVGQATGFFSQIDSVAENKADSGDNAARAVMPEFLDKDVSEVKQALNDNGLGYLTRYIESTDYEKEHVISASLEDGTEVLANDKILMNTTIVLTVSAGADGVNVPSVVGYTEAEATASLTNNGFKVAKSDEYSTEYEKGIVISQSPDGNTIAALESEVNIVISKGSESVEVRMPGVTGYTREAAESVLEAAGLVVGNVEETYSEYPEGQICYQSYEEGTDVSEGTTVDLKVSIGREVSTYSCNLTIQAPEDYIGGDAQVLLFTGDRVQQLWAANNVTSFPVSINLSGFESPSAYGVVTIVYLKSVEEPVVDADGRQTTQINQVPTRVDQNVEFIKDE